jgi:hypothetical protein
MKKTKKVQIDIRNVIGIAAAILGIAMFLLSTSLVVS